MPLQKPQRRRPRPVVSRAFVSVALLGGMLLAIGLQHSAHSIVSAMDQHFSLRQGRNTIAERDAGGASGKLQEELRRIAMGLDRAAHGRSPATELTPLDGGMVELPGALPLYRDEVARYVAETFVAPVESQQFEQMGYPLVVAAVAWLQECDYGGQDSCIAAARVLHLLADVTGVDGLCVQAPVGEPDEALQRRFRAAAAAWRRILERHARDPAMYRSLLLMTRKVRVGDRKD